MSISVLEILSALASIANIGVLLLELYDRWKEHRHRRIVTGEKEKTG
jgi:hypothetical protein